MKVYLLACHAAFAALSLLPPVDAAADTSIDEIIVTADYRQRALAELPFSVSVMDAETIEGNAVQHFEELLSLVPNMNWSGDGHRGRYFQIRGVGELAQYQGAPNPSVGFLVDDIDFSGIGTIATLYDIERVEVLRGPQGTRYGANALAGMIYVRSADPGGPFNGTARVTVGEDNAIGGGVAIGGDLGDRSGYRLSAHHYQANGFRDNPHLGRKDTHGRNETTARASLAWSAGQVWDFRLTALYSDIDDGYDAFAIDNSLTVLSDKPGKDAQESIGTSFRIDWNGSRAFQLTSITALADSAIDFSFDADWGNDESWEPVTYDYISATNRDRQTLSQEVRLTSSDEGRLFNDSTDWLIGVYVNRLDEDLATINLGEYYDPGYDFADSLDDRITSDFEAINAALFGQIDISVGDSGTISAGLRAERRTTEYSDSNGLAMGPSENMAGGELRYSHRLRNNRTVYASLSRGYKAGGFNLGFVPAGQREFQQETMWNFELGARNSFADNLVMLNAAVFYSTRHDQQVETSFQLNPNDPASFVFFTDNAAKGKTLGLETDVTWTPSDAWQLYVNLGLLKAQFDEFRDPLLDLEGRDQAHAPRYTAAAGGTYRHPGGLFARLDLSARDSFYFDVSHDQKSAAYWLANARLGFERNSWTAQVYARNLLDEGYAVRGFYFGNEPPDFPAALYTRQGDPRQIGFTVDYRFGQ